MKRAEENNWPLHQPGRIGACSRKVKKVMVKTEWFRVKPKTSQDHQYTDNKKRTRNQRKPDSQEPRLNAEIFVPRTPNGALAEALRNTKQACRTRSGLRLRVIEEAGAAFRDTLSSPGPWSKTICERKDCAACAIPELKKGSCKQKNIVYDIVCSICK